MHRASILLLLAACQTQDLPLPDNAPPIADNIDWQLVPTTEATAGLETHAFYARNTAILAEPGDDDVCSGSLVDDRLLVTADHCFDPSVQVIEARFGSYGTADGNFDAGLVDMQIRLRQLGIPAGTLATADEDDFRTFRCVRVGDSLPRDITWWECGSKSLQFNYGGQSFQHALYPGHVFGASRIQPDPIQAGTLASVAHANNFCPLSPFGTTGPAFSQMTGIVSRGLIPDVDVDCEDPYYQNCFSTLADVWHRSSGGAVRHPDSHALVGVVRAHTYTQLTDVCTEYQYGYNIMTHMNYVDLFSFREPTVTAPTGTDTSNTDVVGAQIGTPIDLTCPADTLAAGIVGTTLHGQIGDLGLVCTPKGLSIPQLDDATVVASGSTDTMAGPIVEPFHPFMAEVLAIRAQAPDIQHVLAMCPGTDLLKGIRFELDAGGAITGVKNLRCAHRVTGDPITRPVLASQGGAIGTTGQTTDNITCSSPQFVDGLKVFSDGNAIGVGAQCRDVSP